MTSILPKLEVHYPKHVNIRRRSAISIHDMKPTSINMRRPSSSPILSQKKKKPQIKPVLM
jgi:hypothetical protein